jgi:hypothetical protein
MKAGIFAAALSAAAALAGVCAAQPVLPKQPSAAETAALAAQGARPGDDAMTCDQIGMEMQPYVQTMMPSLSALGQTGKEVQALQEKQKAEAAKQAPLGIGAAIAGSFLPGGGVIAQAEAARQNAQMQKRAAEAKPLNDKLMNQSVDLMGVAAPMQQDARFQRLMQMAEAKCKDMKR